MQLNSACRPLLYGSADDEITMSGFLVAFVIFFFSSKAEALNPAGPLPVFHYAGLRFVNSDVGYVVHMEAGVAKFGPLCINKYSMHPCKNLK